MKAWHAPDTQDVRVHLQKLFPDRSVQVNEPEHASPKQVVSTTVRDANIREAHDRSKIYIEVIGRKIIIKLPKNKVDVAFLLNLK